MKRFLAFALGIAIGIGLMALHPRLAVDRVGAGGTPSGNGDVNGSGAIDIADAIYLLSYIFASGPLPEPIVCAGGGLPATGQEMCHGTWGEAIDCARTEFPGMDGFYRAGCPTEGRYVDNGDGTVSDTCTGLMWQKDTPDLSGNGTAGNEDRLTWQGALKYCDGLSLGGHDDWRLPSIRELLSIVDYSRSDPAIDPILGAVRGSYWSSSTYAAGPKRAWNVPFWFGGGDDVSEKSYLFHVRAVRGGQR